MYFIRSDLQHLLLTKISKNNGYLNLTLRLKIKMTLLVEMYYQMYDIYHINDKCMILIISNVYLL